MMRNPFRAHVRFDMITIHFHSHGLTDGTPRNAVKSALYLDTGITVNLAQQ